MFASADLSVKRILWGAGFGAASAGILGVVNDLVAILALDATTVQIGILNALESVSFLVLAVPAGWVLDRIDRGRTLLWTQASATLALISVPVAWTAGCLTFAQLACVSFVVGTASMTWGIGLSSLLITLVDKRSGGRAFAQLQSAETSAKLVAPGVASLLLMVVAAPFTLIFAALAQIFSGLLIIRAKATNRRGPLTPPVEAKPIKFWAGVREGFWFTIRSQPILLSTCAGALANCALALMTSVEAAYLVRSLGYHPSLVALQGTLIGAAGLAGALLATRLLDRFDGLAVACIAMIVGTVGAVALPLTSLNPTSLAYTLPLVASFSILWNSTVVISNAGKFGLLAAVVPHELMGRVQSFRRLISRGPVPLVAVAGGFLGDTIGLVNTLWAFVAVCLSSATLHVLVWSKSRHWNLPAPPMKQSQH